MATTQYIGARYVPLFAEPVEWDSTRQYEPLTIVTNNGNSYTSRQFVPTGIEIDNESFWVLTGNFNAQVEQYRNEVKAYDGRITTAQTTADNAKSLAETNESGIAANDAELAGTADSGLKTMIVEETARAGSAETALGTRIDTADTNIAHLDAQMAATTGSELLNKITKNASDITEINGKKVTIVIGDSWSDKSTTSDAVWPEHFADLTGTTLDNYAKSGAGFTISKNSIATQIDSVISKYSTDSSKKNVKYVIVVAGINDWGHGTHTTESLTNVMYPQIKRLSDAFKANGTTVIWLPNMMWDNSIEQYRFWANNNISATTATGALVLNMFGWFTKNSYNNDMTHLKQDFNKYLGNCLYGIVSGGYVAKNTYSIALSKDTVNATMRMYLFDDHYTLMFFFANTATMSSSSGVAYIDCTELPFPPTGRICAMSNLSNPPLNPTNDYVATDLNTSKLITFAYQCNDYNNLAANKFKGCVTFDFEYFDDIS